MDTQKIEEVRAKFIVDLEEQIWRKECNAAFDETRIPLVIEERTKAIDKVVKLSKEGKAVEDKSFAEKDNTRETREKIKKLKNDIIKENQVADHCEDLISQITNGAKSARIEAKGLRERVEFARNFELK